MATNNTLKNYLTRLKLNSLANIQRKSSFQMSVNPIIILFSKIKTDKLYLNFQD